MSGISLSWENKDRTLLASGTDSYEWVDSSCPLLRELPKVEIVGPEAPKPNGNILVIGDGLDALCALDASTTILADKIRLVYIDPPFNASADVKCYGDTMERSMWLGMLRDRLLALKPHLSDDASVWVHLDDAEVHRARLVMDEVFGDGAFVTSIIWQKRMTRESRSAFSNNHDTILVYAPSGPRKWKTTRNLLAKNTAQLDNRDNDPRGPWADAPFTAPGFRAAQQYPITTPSGKILTPPRGRSWYATESTYKNLLAEDRIWFPKNGGGSPRLKLFSHQLRGLVPFTIWSNSETGTNDEAKRHLLSIFPNGDVFDTPKPEELLERIIHISTQPGELVVDLFAGSGTTAAVAHKMRRKWITVERNIQTVCDFTLPRLQAVTSGEDRGGISDIANWRGGGEFSVLEVSPRLGRPSNNSCRARIEKLLSSHDKIEAKVAG
jgi:adenine-specific DNA-methyltransferase